MAYYIGIDLGTTNSAIGKCQVFLGNSFDCR